MYVQWSKSYLPLRRLQGQRSLNLPGLAFYHSGIYQSLSLAGPRKPLSQWSLFALPGDSRLWLKGMIWGWLSVSLLPSRTLSNTLSFCYPRMKTISTSALFTTGAHVCSNMGVVHTTLPKPFQNWAALLQLTAFPTWPYRSAQQLPKISAFCKALQNQYFQDPCIKPWFSFFACDGCIIKSLTFFQSCYH